MKIAEQKQAGLNEKSVQEVSKQNPGRFPKSDMRHWKEKLFRQSYTRDGETRLIADWSVKLQWRGRRETFNLHTSNQSAAAATAKEVYTMLAGAGWEATLAKFKPDMKRKETTTVGGFLTALRDHWSGRPETFESYCKQFRTMLAAIFGIKGDAARYDYKGGGREKWVAKIDRIKLARVTPAKVDRWRIAFVKKAGSNPVAQRRARISCNSILRQAKSLFAPKLLAHMGDGKPASTPFQGVMFYERESMRYHSTVDIEALIQEAVTALEAEPLKAFLLATMAGLRRNEIDKLQWGAFRWNEGVVRIEATEHFSPKTADSAGDVPIDQELMAMFRGWHAKATGPFVIEADGEPRKGARSTTYRAEKHFHTLTAWLRGKGVTTPKPLHEMRKEYGSQLCQKYGIYAASRALRHTDIALTAAHYLDRKERVTIGMGKLLPMPENVTPMEAAV
jgi:hypothetical protein